MHANVRSILKRQIFKYQHWIALSALQTSREAAAVVFFSISRRAHTFSRNRRTPDATIREPKTVQKNKIQPLPVGCACHGTLLVWAASGVVAWHIQSHQLKPNGEVVCKQTVLCQFSQVQPFLHYQVWHGCRKVFYILLLQYHLSLPP